MRERIYPHKERGVLTLLWGMVVRIDETKQAWKNFGAKSIPQDNVITG